MLPMATHDHPARQQWDRQYRSTPRSVAFARREVAEALEEWRYGDEDIERIVLVCSELATNAVRHGRSPGRLFEVRVTDGGTDCLIEVSDAGARLPRLRFATPEDEGGRGLSLVAALAKDCGHHPRDPIGKTVWARVELNSRTRVAR